MLRPETDRSGLEEALAPKPATGLEETAPGKRRRYDPTEVSGRILDALVSNQELSHWKGTVILSHNQAARLAGGKPYRKSFDTNPGLVNGVNQAFETAFAEATPTPAAQALRNHGITQVVIQKGVDAKDTAYDPGEVAGRLLEKLLASPKNRQGVKNESLILPYKRVGRLLDRRPTDKAFADNGSLVNRVNMALYHAFKEKPPLDSGQAFTHWELALRLKKRGISRVRLQKARYSYDPTEVAYRLLEELLKEGTFSGEVALPFLRASKLLAGEPSVPTLMQNGALAAEINRALTQAFEPAELPVKSDVHPHWIRARQLQTQGVTGVRIFNAGAGYYRPPTPAAGLPAPASSAGGGQAGLEESGSAPLNVNRTRQDLLLSHLQQLRRASRANSSSIASLDDATLVQLAAAILDGTPYRNRDALIQHLNGKVPSVKKPQVEVIARSLQTGTTRRQFGFQILAGAATSTLVGAGLGWLWNRWGPVTIPEELVRQGRVTDVLGLILRDPDHPSIRSAEATRVMTQALLDAHPSFLTQERKLTLLYPGSGSHVTPLEIASRLIAENHIDEARYIFTEIDEKALLELEGFLLALVEQGLYTNFSREEQAFEEGREITFRFEFQGKPITILFALNRSGKKFWRSEYAQAVHLIYSHDASPGEQRFYAELLEDFYGDGTDRGELFLMGEDVRRHGVFTKSIPATNMPEGIEFGYFDPELLGAVTPVPRGFGHRSTMSRQEESRHPEQVTHDERGNYIFPGAYLVRFDGIFLRKLSSLPNYPYRVLSDLSAAAAGRPASVDYFSGRALRSSNPIPWGIDLQRGVREILDVVPEGQTNRRARLLLDVLSIHWSTGHVATTRQSISRDVFTSWFLQEPEVIWLAEKLVPVIDAVPELLGGSGEAIEPNDFRKQWRSAVGELLVQVVSPMSDEQLTLQPFTRDWIYLHTLDRQLSLSTLILGTPELFLSILETDPDSVFRTVRGMGRFGIGRSIEEFQNALRALPDHPSVPPSQKEPLRQAVEDALQKIRSIEQEDHQPRRPAGGSTPLTTGLEEVTSYLDQEARGVIQELRQSGIPVKVRMGPQREILYEPVPLHPESAVVRTPGFKSWGRGMKRRFLENNFGPVSSQVISDTTGLPEGQVFSILTAAPMQAWESFLKQRDVPPSLASEILRIKSYLDEARTINLNLAMLAALRTLSGNDRTFGPLQRYLNHILENRGKNPRISADTPAIRAVREELTELELWMVKEGNDAFVIRAEAKLKDGRKVPLVVNIAKDFTDAAELVRRAFKNLTADYAFDPRHVMEPLGLTEIPVRYDDLALPLPVFVGEWVEGYDEPHVKSENGTRFEIWERSGYPGEPLSQQASDEIWRRLIWNQAYYSVVDHFGPQGAHLAITEPNAGDQVVIRRAGKSGEESWDAILIWDRGPEKPTDPSEVVIRGILPEAVAFPSAQSMFIWWSSDQAIPLVWDALLEQTKRRSEREDPRPKLLSLFRNVHERVLDKFRKSPQRFFDLIGGLVPETSVKLADIKSDMVGQVDRADTALGKFLWPKLWAVGAHVHDLQGTEWVVSAINPDKRQVQLSNSPIWISTSRLTLLDTAGLEERTSESVRLLRQVPPAISGSVGNEALVFLPGTYDLAAVAAQMGAAVAVPDDGPEAAGLEELLRAMHAPADRYAVGILQASRFLEGYSHQILVDNRPKGFRVLGLRWDDLPPPVAAALESVLIYLDRVRQA